jgi:hypothetical protein
MVMQSLVPARLALAILSLMVTMFIKHLSADLYLKHRNLFNTVTTTTYFLGLLAAISKLFFESSPSFLNSANHLGEVCIALAMALHETMHIWRYTILLAGTAVNVQWRVLVWATIWMACLYRIAAEFLPINEQTEGIKLAAGYTFYGYTASMDILVSSLSLRIMYQIKLAIMSGRRDKRAIGLLRRVQIIILAELVTALVALFLNLPIDDANLAIISKPATDLCIYIAGYCALLYSSNLMLLIKYKPNNNANNYILSKPEPAVKPSLSDKSTKPSTSGGVKRSAVLEDQARSIPDSVME